MHAFNKREEESAMQIMVKDALTGVWTELESFTLEEIEKFDDAQAREVYKIMRYATGD